MKALQKKLSFWKKVTLTKSILCKIYENTAAIRFNALILQPAKQ